MRSKNEWKGLRIAGTNFEYLDRGAFGIIFADKQKKLVRKVYKWDEEEKYVYDVFCSEVKAYTLAANSSDVATLVPGNFQLCEVQKITDINGEDITKEFFPKFAFETEYVPGYFKKISCLEMMRCIDMDDAEWVHKFFKNAGICFTGDMSVVLESDGTIFKAIDFAVREYEKMHRD